MNSINELFNQELKVINVGLEQFAANLRKQDVSVTSVSWSPNVFANANLRNLLSEILNSSFYPEIHAANVKAVDKIFKSQPSIVGIGKAIDVVPGMKKDLFLHAGPPIQWDRMSGPLKGGMIGGILYEKLASNVKEAEEVLSSNRITFEPCHHHLCVGPMAGIITPNMPVWIIKNETFGNYAYATLNEGLGKVLRYGAFSQEVIDRLNWMDRILAPTLTKTLEKHGPVDLKSLITQALQMGDEGHNRNRAGTSLLIRELCSDIVQVDMPQKDIVQVLNFINSNDHFFLNLTMPASKCTMDATLGIENSSMVSIMARNGTDFGIKLGCIPDKWFIAPAEKVDGLYFPPYTIDDANPDIGDSVITETAGIGGFAMASAPAIVQFVGGTTSDATKYTLDMYNITIAEHNNYKIPAFDFRGTPVGIDILKVIDTGILPNINTGIAHKEPGIGMVGAGLVKPPAKCFEQAINAFYKKYRSRL